MDSWQWMAGLFAIFILVIFTFVKRYGKLSTSKGTLVPASEPLSMALPKSPLLSVSFEEAFETQALCIAMADYGRESVVVGLGLDPVNFILQGLSFAENRNTLAIAYEYTKSGTARYMSGTATIPLTRESGRLLPMLSDKETGRFIELATGKPLHLLKLAQVSALIVSAAHVISGMDIVKQMEKVDRKVDYLLAGRAIDQRAHLREIYMMSRELLAGDLTDFERAQLVVYRGKLLNLRSVWLDELKRSIGHAPDPDKVAWINRKTKWGRTGREKKLKDELLEDAERLKLYRFASVLDLCLAQSTGTAHLYIEQTLPDELRQWVPVAENFVALTKKVTNPKMLEEVEALGESVTGFTRSLVSLTSGASARGASVAHQTHETIRQEPEFKVASANNPGDS